MAAPCYCCSQKADEQNSATNSESTNHMDLDAALFELGMLSSVTESRHQYVGEQWKKYEDLVGRRSSRFGNPPHTHSGACVLQMNSKYVTKFSFAPELSSGSADQESERDDETSDMGLKCCTNSSNCRSFVGSTSADHAWKQAKMKSRKYRYYYSPYRNHYLPWLHRQEDSARKLVHQPLSSSSSEGGSTPSGTPRQDSGNKSNPGSPVKNEKAGSSTGCSIIRSRSLDDLDINKLGNSFQDTCSNLAGRAEIETVSQRISNLHVS